MDIDQRLEALAQSVELIAHMQMKNEEAHEKNEEAHLKNEILIGQVMESVNSLARIAHVHERRLSRLEGDQN